MTITDPPRLAVHVLGAAKGESIILEMPGGRWGVVDCYTTTLSDPSANPTLRYLRERGATELDFLALTHPHDDHFKGMSQLLEQFPVQFFWRFPGISGKHLEQLAASMRIRAERNELESEIEKSTEFARIFGLVQKRREEQIPPLRQKLSASTVQLFPVPFNPDSPVQVLSLSPSADQVAEYERALVRYLEAVKQNRRPPEPRHNLVSAAFLVIFGQTRILLGGDVERNGWQDVLKDFKPSELAVDMVKLSHHGSTNGYCDGLWAQFASRVPPVGVVTAYAAQNLPRREALDEAIPYIDTLITTCGTCIKDEQFPSSTDPSEFRSRLGLRHKMGGLVNESRHACGRCSLIFDDEGHLVARELESPAEVMF